MQRKGELQALKIKGKISRQHVVPEFEDINQYLDYLRLDEPIIGLDYLVEIPGEVGDLSGIKYLCTLCHVYAYISEAVQHVIGRKHRQKYLEKRRLDLVNWDTQRPQTKSGKLIRAKAEIAERQDGQGKPKPLPDKTKRRLYPSFRGGPRNPQDPSFSQDMGPILPNFGSYSSDNGRQMSDNYMQERYEDTSERYKPENLRKPVIYPGLRDFEREGGGGFSDVLGLQDQDRRQYSQRDDQYSDAFRQPPAQKDVLKEFYTEELRREQMAKAQKWPNDTAPHHLDHTRRLGDTGPGAHHSNYQTSVDGQSAQDNYKLVTDYGHETLVERPHEALSHPGLSRVSPSRSGEMSRKMSNIPDPFMRFLKGEPSHEQSKGAKRKSRFSDATAEELQTAHDMYTDDYGPPKSKFSSRRPEDREQNTRGLRPTDPYLNEPLPECSDSAGDVFDMLKNIEIENEEEANFLKERLCIVLKEFEARKAEKAAQMGPSRYIKEYSHTRPVTLHHAQDRYDDPHQVSYDEQRLDEHFQGHDHPGPPEARYSNRKHFEEVKRWPNNDHPQHSPGFDMPAPGYDMPPRARDYQSTDHFSDYPPMEREPRMNRLPQYSRNLDKITSTLLELVKRK